MSEDPRLDVLLHWLCVSKSRSQAANWCREGKVFVDGTLTKPSAVLKAGQKVEIRATEQPLRLEILEIPTRAVARSQRDRYLKVLSS